MTIQIFNERTIVESRVSAVRDLVEKKLMRSDASKSSFDKDAVESFSEEGFPFVWDFNKPWRNK